MGIIHKVTLILTKDLITDGFCIILCLLELCKLRPCAAHAGASWAPGRVRTARRLPRIDTARLIRRGSGFAVLLLIAAFFLAGAVAGAVAGSGDNLPAGETILPGDGSVYGQDSYPGLLFSCARYHLLVLLFSTSLIGVLLIPATLAFRGFTLSCSAAYLVAAYQIGRASCRERV